MDLKVHQLRAFAEIIDCGGIRAAARQLGVTQAALTKTLQNLEESAGVSLLVRRASGVTPTRAGEALLARARYVLSQAQELEADIRRFHGAPAGRVSACITTAMAATGMQGVLSCFRSKYPGVNVAFIQATTYPALNHLLDGTADMAVIDEPADLGPEYVMEVLTSIPRIPVVRAGHPILAQPSARALSHLEWIRARVPHSIEQQRLAAAFRIAGAEPPARALECSALIGLQIVLRSDAVVPLPVGMLAQLTRSGYSAVDAPDFRLPDRRQGFVRRRGIDLTGPGAHMRDCILEFLRSQTLLDAPFPRWH